MRASLRTIIAAVFVCLSIGVGSASAASPGPRPGTLVLPDVWGWVVARHPTTNQYTPAPQDRQNSLGTTNRMRRDGAGIYDALYPQLEPGALNAGTALVAAFGQARDTFCANDDFGWHFPDPAQVSIACFDRHGNLVDSRTTAVLIDAQGLAGRSGYVWNNDPTAPTAYIPDPGYQFDSTGGPVTIARSATGRYQVLFPGLGTARGNVQISNGLRADVFKPAVCRVLDWEANSADLQVDVQCRKVNGSPVDAVFYTFFSRGQGIKGPGVGAVAYLDANHPFTADYTPASARSFSSASLAPHVHRSGPGAYIVTLPGMPQGGVAHVTPYGAGSSRCYVSSIRSTGTPQKVGVRCTTADGAPLDSEFGLTYAR